MMTVAIITLCIGVIVFFERGNRWVRRAAEWSKLSRATTERYYEILDRAISAESERERLRMQVSGLEKANTLLNDGMGSLAERYDKLKHEHRGLTTITAERDDARRELETVKKLWGGEVGRLKERIAEMERELAEEKERAVRADSELVKKLEQALRVAEKQNKELGQRVREARKALGNTYYEGVTIPSP